MSTSFQNFIEYLTQFHDVSDQLTDYLQASIRETVYPKNHTILQAGKYPKELNYIVSGCARAYRYDELTAQELTVWFYNSTQLILPLSGPDALSKWFITMERTTTVISISHIHLKYLHVLFPEYHFINRGYLELMISRLSEHLDIVQHQKFAEGYLKTIQENPGIFQSGTLRDIASFLGMSESTLKHLKYKGSVKGI